MKRILSLTLMVLFIAWPFYSQAKTIGVDPDGACSCYPEATDCYTSINQAILLSAPGDAIVVCPGVYNENVDFIGINVTVRSVDPNDPEIVDSTIIDGGYRGPVVSFIEGEGPSAKLSGLTLRNGRGGIFCRSSSPTITECKIIGNVRGPYGGGIYCENASPDIIHCAISNNTADIYGGGIYCTSSSPTISYCIINANNGGGIACEEGSEPKISHCTIEGNKANPDSSYGYGILSNDASPVITDCTIRENSEDGINCLDNAPFLTTITDCSITGNNSNGISFSGDSPPRISACNIHYNKGMGIYYSFDPNSESSTTIETCTINWNESHGIYCINSINAPLTINDCNIQENSNDGIYCGDSHITINHCTVKGNINEGVQCMSSSSLSVLDCIIGKNGGTGIYAESSTSRINDSTIHENEKGGIYCRSCAPEIINCQIISNSSDNGGGIYCTDNTFQEASPSVIRDCTISRNSVSGSGGGIYLNNSSLKIDNCNINKNKANNGGGIYTNRSNYNNDYRIYITRCSLIKNLAYSNGGGIYSNLYPVNETNPYPTNAENCLISQNGARYGGGIYCNRPMNVINCTIVENQGQNYGGIYCCSWASSQIKNCILWNNHPHEIYGGNSIITFSDIRGGANGDGNIDSDPMFVDSEIGNYYLRPGSPCIDNGHPNCLCENDPNCIEKGDPNDALPYDKEGIRRPQGCAVDIGAYEFVDPCSCTPRASFKADKVAGTVPLEVEFDASSSGGSLYENPNDPNYPLFLWDFGDGNTGEGERAIHTYNSYGTFDVSLTVITDCNSHTLTMYNFIKAGSSEPTRHVGDIGEGYDHASIQEAIDDAEDGEYILVHDGTYFERINFKGKWIRIQSEQGAEKTILDGGGIGRVVTFNNREDTYSVLEGVTIQNGSAADGAGIYCYYSSPTISRCIIRKNSAVNNGGGIYCYRSSPSITNCVIVENMGGYDGGIYCSYSSPSIINNTIIKNIGGHGRCGGISCYSYSAPIIKNCILWDNLPNEIYNSGGTPIITCSDIRGGYSGDGNINKDPLFIGSETGNYYLDANSSCIDSGDSANAPLFDKEGIPRNQDAGIDMGAYEYVDTSSCTPRASFTANETAGHYPLRVMFDASSSGGSGYNGVQYFWEFGDGNTAMAYDTIIEHTYNDPNDFNDPNDPYGSYNVSLTITTECGSHILILDDLIKIKSLLPTKEVGMEGDYPYSSIQNAIDDARNGEFILVHDRTYYENLDFKGKRITVRSENGPFTTCIDGGAQGSVVAFKRWEDRYSVLEGFTIRNGSSNNGGGIHCWGSSPHIVNCRLMDNNIGNYNGGGIYCYASSASIEQCSVSGNYSRNGGGVYCEYSSPLIAHCDILENERIGIYLRNSSGTFKGSTINTNIYGGIECYSSSPEIINCIIARNIDDNSGGIYCDSSSPSIINCTIADNETGYYGAGGIYCQSSSSPIITNSILWSPNSPKEIEKDYYSNPKVTFSDVRGCYPGEGNICADPSFVAAWAGFYYLRADSPCIEMGDPNREAPIIDIDDIQRPLDGDLDGLAIHEMGVYEWVLRNQCIPRPCFDATKVSDDGWTYSFNALCSGGSFCADPNDFWWNFGDGNSARGIAVDHTYVETGFHDVTLTVTINGESRDLRLNDYIKIPQDPNHPDIMQVCKGGACDFERIQDAIESAEEGDLILVHDGIYKENINFRGKQIILYSANGPDNTFIDGSGSGTVVTFNNFEDMYSVLDGFTIQNGNANGGGGIYCYFSSPSISNCIIRDNRNDNSYGGGVYSYCSSPGFTNCTITGNRARHGGGIYFYYSSSINLSNCVITKNMARELGGGIYLNSCLEPNITHCTIADNKSGSHGGGLYSSASSPAITNCIIWNNSPNGIYGDIDPDKATFNDIQEIPDGFKETDLYNISTDPLFVAPEIGNYYLRPESTCINSGIYVLTFDREEIPRPQDEDEAVDMGAFEFVNRRSCIPRPSFEAIPHKGESPLTVNFNATSSGGWLSEDPNEIATFLWDFGDGTIIQGPYYESILVEHTYTDPYGFYDVSLTVINKYGFRSLKIRNCIKVKAKDPTREVGEGYDYSLIQEAIDDAENGEYILVHNGTYPENINFKGKGITLCSAYGPEATIINGSSTVVEFSNGEDDFSVLEGFTIQNGSSRNYSKIYCSLSSPRIERCVIKGGSTCCAETGYDLDSGIYCDYCSSPQVINCLIIGNRRRYGGGGIYCNLNSSPEITHCTISNNYANNNGGAIYALNYSSPIITNSILWGNLCGNPSSNEIYYSGWNASIRITFSDIQDIPEEYTDPNLHNIDLDPYFVNPCECNYRIPFDSPCFDACDCKEKDDIEGKPRPIHERCDMGAYEYGTPPLTKICLESQEEGACIELGIFKESKVPCPVSPAPGLSFIDPDDPNQTPYCEYIKALQYILPYHWSMKLDFEAYMDPNSSFFLKWEPERLPEQDQWTWKLVQGADINGNILVNDMTLVDNYQIREEDGEYLSILFEEPNCQEFYLNSGWNLVSIPIITTDMSRTSLFQDAIAVYYYDANQQIYIYIEEDELMRPCTGYWVLVNEQVTRKICSITPDDIVTSYATLDSPDGLRLEEGWNMIGSLYGYTALSVSEGYIKAVFEYTNDGVDNGYNEPSEFDPNSGAYLVSGKGYWILPSVECFLNGNAIPELPNRERLRMLFSPRFREAASSDNWIGKITAFGQKSHDCSSKARIKIGISDTPVLIPSPPNPPCTTIELNLINPPSDYTKYTKDIRSVSQETLHWVLWIKDNESSDPNYPLLQWEIPSGLDRVLELRKGQSETGDILVEDMRMTSSYQLKEGDGELLTVVWTTGPSPTICYRDTDDDSYGDANDSIQANQAGVCPEGYVKDNTDCDDQDPNSYPGAAEICDEKDNDCDDEIDEDLHRVCSNACGDTGTETCVNGRWENCTAPLPPEETCDGEDNDCDGEFDEEGAIGCTTYYMDTDQDGYGVNRDTMCLCTPENPYNATLGGDCNDNDPYVYPRLVSVADAKGYPGETDVTVPITIDEAIGFAGGDIILTYDPNILTAREVIIAPLIQGFLTNSYIIEVEGTVVLVMANSTALESGSGALVGIIFDVSEEAGIGTKVPLVLEQVIINDADSNPYCSLGINGEFRIVERGHKGDLNQDGEITSADAILALKISVGILIPSDYQDWAGDVNNDDEINAADAILILRAAVTKETIFYLAPDHGLPGETVKIIGWNFGETQGDSVLYLGDIPADPISWMDYEIETTMPSEIQAGTLDISLINAYGYSSNSREFIVGTINQRLKSSNTRYSSEGDLNTVRISAGIIITPCNQVNIPVETDDAKDIAGMDIELGFDPEVLIPVKVESTALTEGFLLMFKDSGDGSLRVSLANEAGIIEGSGALINVVFEVTSSAMGLDSTGITISYIKLYDEGANSLEELVFQGGQVLIEGDGSCEKEQTPGTPIYSPGNWALPYYPYYHYTGYYFSPGNFSLEGNWMSMFETYTLGNGYNYSSSGNPYNYPLGSGYNYLLGNVYRYPTIGNSYNYTSGNGYNYPYQGWQEFLNPVFYWMPNIYEYNNVPNRDYQEVYPDVSGCIIRGVL